MARKALNVALDLLIVHVRCIFMTNIGSLFISAFVGLGDYSVFSYISVCDAKDCYQCAGDACGGDYGANTNKISKKCSDTGSKCFVRRNYIQWVSLYYYEGHTNFIQTKVWK